MRAQKKIARSGRSPRGYECRSAARGQRCTVRRIKNAVPRERLNRRITVLAECALKGTGFANVSDEIV